MSINYKYFVKRSKTSIPLKPLIRYPPYWLVGNDVNGIDGLVEHWIEEGGRGDSGSGGGGVSVSVCLCNSVWAGLAIALLLNYCSSLGCEHLCCGGKITAVDAFFIWEQVLLSFSS